MIAKELLNGDQPYTLQGGARDIYQTIINDKRLNIPEEVKALADRISFNGEETQPFYPSSPCPCNLLHNPTNRHPPLPPGPPFIPAAFSPGANTADTKGYVFNHVALQIRSVAASLSFYSDFFDMSLIFALNAGPFTACYLGYPEEGDGRPGDMVGGMGRRAGLLELVRMNDRGGLAEETGNGNAARDGGGDGSDERWLGSRKGGLAHLGFRVPDVAETLRRAEEKGWKVSKRVNDVDVKYMYESLPGGEQEAQRGWEGGFEKTFAQIGFVRDPDGNWIEILPREMKRS